MLYSRILKYQIVNKKYANVQTFDNMHRRLENSTIFTGMCTCILQLMSYALNTKKQYFCTHVLLIVGLSSSSTC